MSADIGIGVEAAVTQLLSLADGRSTTAIGLDSAALLAAASLSPTGSRAVLVVETGDAFVSRVLQDLAEVALAAWPAWPPIAPNVPSSWRRAADRLAAAGRRPLFRSVAPEIQFSALHRAAGAPVLALAIDALHAVRAAPTIAAMEWCARRGAATIAMLAERPAFEPPWDRILHDAIVVSAPSPSPALSRIAPPPVGPRGSAVERRMRAALAADLDLAGLFDNEVTLRLGPAFTPRVDLLWAKGRVVVELDGIEHERGPTYGADRHRDYELLVAGYLVLRLTNAEVDLDLARSLEKVRRVVNLRRGQP